MPDEVHIHGVKIELHPTDADRAAQEVVAPLLEILQKHVDTVLEQSRSKDEDARQTAFLNALIESLVVSIQTAFHIGVLWQTDREKEVSKN
jgi:hypothetical protein